MAVSDPPPPSSPSPSLGVARSSTPTSTSVRAYLRPVTSLDNASLETLKSLLRITVDIRRNTSRTHRIGRGSPGAGALGVTLASLQPRLEEIAHEVAEVLKTHQDFPGMYQVSRQFPEFRDVLNGHFNDGGNDPGYNERVHLLERLMYVAGTLRGQIELVLEQHGYWKAKLSGEQPTRLARRLNFDLAVDPATEGGEGLADRAALAAEDSLQRELPSADKTFKVSVSLPQELHAALAHIWEEQKFTDIDFRISGQIIPAHKAVLASQSQYFESMLYGSMREASMNEVELKDVSVPTFRKVLQFAYTGSLDMENVTLQDILEVSSVADRFGFVSLKQALGDQLSQKYISLETVLLLLVHSDIYHLQQLHKACVAFIENKEHSVQVLTHPSLLHLPKPSLAAIISRDTFVAPEIEILRAVQRWKEHNTKPVEEITELLECVRLSEFSSSKQIFMEVEPTGLLDSETILAGVRAICKPCLTEMRPRGRKERDSNLFTKPKVDFHPSCTSYHIQCTSHDQPRNLSVPPQRCVADSIVSVGEGYPKRGILGHSRNTVIIALDDLYIINCLSFKGYPSIPDGGQMEGNSFSYQVSLSKDQTLWMEVFDYSTFACWGAQDLPFPPQSARFVRVEVRWREDKASQIPLQFSACCFVSTPRPFSFLPNGVIAPKYEHGVVTVSMSWEREVLALFRQPYSTSFLRFSLECTDKEVESVDMIVSVSLTDVHNGGQQQGHSTSGTGGKNKRRGRTLATGGTSAGDGFNTRAAAVGTGQGTSQQEATGDVSWKDPLKLKEIIGAPLNQPLEFYMKEKVVNGVLVEIRKIYRKHQDTTRKHPVVTTPPSLSATITLPTVAPTTSSAPHSSTNIPGARPVKIDTTPASVSEANATTTALSGTLYLGEQKLQLQSASSTGDGPASLYPQPGSTPSATTITSTVLPQPAVRLSQPLQLSSSSKDASKTQSFNQNLGAIATFSTVSPALNVGGLFQQTLPPNVQFSATAGAGIAAPHGHHGRRRTPPPPTAQLVPQQAAPQSQVVPSNAAATPDFKIVNVVIKSN